MITIADTTENNVIVKALKKINQCQWVGNTIHETLDKCLVAINYATSKNSGWYNPTASRINGLTGIYMINQDGSICFDFRVIKEDDKTFRIEEMTMKAYNDFEDIYSKLIDEN